MKGKLIGWILSMVLKTPKNFDEQMCELYARTWANRPTTKAKSIVGFHGRAWGDDEPSLFDYVADLVNNNMFTVPVLVNGSAGQRKGSNIRGESWPGGQIFKDELLERRVKDVRLFPNDDPKPDYRADTTVEESEMMLDHAVNHGFEQIILVSWQHQMVRCLVSMVKAMKKARKFIYVSCECPPYCSWLRIVKGSQGMNNTERKNHIRLELMSLKFILKNEPSLIADTLKFLDNMESGVPLWTGILTEGSAI